MAWSSPPLWVAGQVVTAAEMNTYIRSNLRFLKGTDGVVTLDDALIIATADGRYLQVPSMTTANLPATPAAGMIVYDTTTLTFKRYENGAWVSFTDLAAMTIASIAQGDIFYRGASVIARLAAGTSGYFLKTQGAGANPIWVEIPYVDKTILTLQGQVPYASAASTWAALATGTAGQVLKTQGVGANPAWVNMGTGMVETRNFIIDGGGAVIATGQKGHMILDFPCTINQVTLLANASGSIVIDIWKDTYANFPPTVADSICAAAKPTLSSAQKSQDSTLTGWTTSIVAGDVLAFNVDSATTVQRVLLSLKLTRT